jgi:hypothetical protein
MKTIIFENANEFKSDSEYRWLAKNGRKLLPSEMETSHLFYVIRMIWNNSMPEDAKIEPYVKYTDILEWTPKYVKDSLTNIIEELKSRKDVDVAWASDFNKMYNYFSDIKNTLNNTNQSYFIMFVNENGFEDSEKHEDFDNALNSFKKHYETYKARLLTDKLNEDEPTLFHPNINKKVWCINKNDWILKG